MHLCPRCGKATDGAWSEGGLKWAICEECMGNEIETSLRRQDLEPAGFTLKLCRICGAVLNPEEDELEDLCSDCFDQYEVER